MKSFVACSIIASAVSLELFTTPTVQEGSEGNRTSEVVFQKGQRRALRKAGSKMVKYTPECYLPLDLMFLQDTTGSFKDDLPQVVSQLGELMDFIESNHPDTMFGVAEFRDKPYGPLGLATDFCYKLGGRGSLRQAPYDTIAAYESLCASGGEDLPEAQYQALIDVALDSRVGWRTLAAPGAPAGPGEAGARVVIMSTDAAPHDPAACKNYNPADWPNCPRNFPENSGTIGSVSDIENACTSEDYPFWYQVRDVLENQSVHLLILTPNDTKIIPVWTWFNEEALGQPSEYYQFIESDSSDFKAGVTAALESLVKSICPTIKTTLEPTEETSTPASGSTESSSDDSDDECCCQCGCGCGCGGGCGCGCGESEMNDRSD